MPLSGTVLCSEPALWTGMRGIAPVPEYIVMQANTLCNLACTYCYLPDRAFSRPMSVEIARAAADAANPWARSAGAGFAVVWHGGEPLAVGRPALAELMEPFVGVEHQIQTNATLINDPWCEFFAEHGVRVSISVDGPAERNEHRVIRGFGRPAYPRIMKGVEALRRNGLDFAALCVVSAPRQGFATELYEYFLDLGCDALGISIEEQEGVNERPNDEGDDAVGAFWAELVEAWKRDPRIRVREIDHVLGYVAALRAGTADAVLPRTIDPMPMVAPDGRVYLLSPELAGFSDPRYGDFSAGNILDTPLPEIVQRAAEAARSTQQDDGPDGAHGDLWIAEYLAGVESCRRDCAYFGFCGGAQAGNRYFEHRRFDLGRTNHCRNSKIRLLDGAADLVPEDAVAACAGVGTFYNWNNRPR